MNEMDQLRTLDPARHWEPSDTDRRSADAMVERVIAVPPQFTPQSASRTGRRILLTSAAAAVIAVGVTLTPSLWPGGSSAQAYAAWATPGTMSEAQALAMARECAAGWGPSWGRAPVASDIVLAETRNEGSLLLIAKGGSEDLADCMTLDGDGGVGGADLLPASAPEPGVEKVTIQGMGASQATSAGGWTSEVIGRVAEDVIGVDVVMDDGQVVHASVQGGWWVAWWPGHEGGEDDTADVVVHSRDGDATYVPSQLFWQNLD
ncbi:hypothetical protein [Kineosporia succinea]|uniref:Uncharacterized protein n=1 Tax=Kineosporia succinea TaxID=84632 RepID=A0ABT9PC60_9ACTN|nr:hypothetical protein [Kineosporia succinea]MDP9830288.1 hypothetical protein [Kineosporia succinea]